MTNFNTKQLTEMHTGLSAKRLCADVSYWLVGSIAGVESDFTSNNEQPIKMASFRKEFRNT